MKVRTIILLSVVALCSIVTIQLAGMFYAYSTRLKEAQIELEKCFTIAYAETVDNLVNGLPFPNLTVVHIGNCPDSKIGQVDSEDYQRLFVQQTALALQKVYGVKEIPLATMDSVLHHKWKKTGIEGDIVVERLNLHTGEMLESTNKAVHSGWFSVTSEPIFTYKPRGEACRAIISFPSNEIGEKVLLLFLITLLLLYVAIYALVKQLKAVVRQKRSLQEQQQDFYALAQEMGLPIRNIRDEISDSKWGSIEMHGTTLFNRTEATLTKAKRNEQELWKKKMERPAQKFSISWLLSFFKVSSRQVAVLSLVGVFLFLGVWSAYLYYVAEQNMKLQVEEKLENAFYSEVLNHRYSLSNNICKHDKVINNNLKFTPYSERLYRNLEKLHNEKGYKYKMTFFFVYHIYNKLDENSLMHAAYTLQDSINHNSPLPIPFSLHHADSVFKSGLAETGISHRGDIHWLKHPSGELLHYVGSPDVSFWDISTKLIPLDEDSTTCVKGVLRQPQRSVISSIWYLQLPLAITFLFVCCCVFFLVRLLRMQRQLKQFQKDFTYSMIHDMKSPLQSIMVGAHILSSGKLVDKPDKQQRHIQAMRDECEHLLALSNRVVMLAQLDKGELELRKETVDIKVIFANLAEKFRLKTPKPLHFEFGFEEKEDKTVFADAFCLYEVLSNLIDNAVKYSGDEVTITFSVHTMQTDTLICIRDNGIGIPLRAQKKIFGKFGRVSSNSRKTGASGFGLGLNYVTRVMQAHGGNISVESVEGKYSEFALCFPN